MYEHSTSTCSSVILCFSKQECSFLPFSERKRGTKRQSFNTQSSICSSYKYKCKTVITQTMMHAVLYQQQDCLLPRKPSSKLDKTPPRTARPGLTPQETLSGQPEGREVLWQQTGTLVCCPSHIQPQDLPAPGDHNWSSQDLKNTPNEGKCFEAAPAEAKLLSHGKQQGQM